MATVGHTLIGLSFAGMSRAAARDNTMRYTWPGLMVLMGHLVDVIEWFTVVLLPRWSDGHYLTHKPLAVAGFVFVVLLIVAAATRLRRPWPYVLIVIAVFSHLPMDASWVRDTIAWLYHVAPFGYEGYLLQEMVVAEVWIYGLPLLLVLLARAGLQRDCPSFARRIAGALGVLAVLAAATRLAAVWLPVYFLSFCHAAMLLRRDLSVRLLWGALLLLPLGANLAGEVYANYLLTKAWNLYLSRRYDDAIAAYDDALRFPMRASPLMSYVHIGQCHEASGRFAQAESMFQRAAAAEPVPNWGQYWLAWFYASRNRMGTPYYRPGESVRMLEELLRSSNRPRIKEIARGLLDDIRARPDIHIP